MPYKDKEKRNAAAEASAQRTGRRKISINAPRETAASWDKVVAKAGGPLAALQLLLKPYSQKGRRKERKEKP